MIWVMCAVVFAAAGAAMFAAWEKAMKRPVPPGEFEKKMERLDIWLDAIAWAIVLSAVCALVGIVVIAGGVR